MDELLGIGDFSARCGLSPKMLRSYAAAGLLAPAAVDASSGYRYYSADQVQRARVIALLRRAGIPVATIAEFFRDPTSAEIDRWERDIESEFATRRRALAQARSALTAGIPRSRTPPDSSRKGTEMTHSLVAGSATDRGQRDANQDAALVGDGLFAVADGLGGLQDGEVASRLALEALQAAFAADRSRTGLLSACEEANEAVWRQATAKGEEPTMGTTLAAIGIVADGEPVVVHVGDSRMYRFRNGRLDQLTADHSITGDLVRAGRLTETEALNHPQRHILTRALGVSPQVQVDVSDVSCEPGDRLLLCTDGVSKALSHQQIETALAATSDAQRLADDLITAAVTQGAEDNVTAVVVELS